MTSPLLSIAIPAYNRPNELLYAVEKFKAQLTPANRGEIEIIIVDDASPGNSLEPVARFCDRDECFTFKRHESNIGLEKNLIACTQSARGEFLWIFGDDDFLETDDALQTVVDLLRTDHYDFLVLNRSRRTRNLSRVIHDNWMRLNPNCNTRFKGLRDYCLRYGFISIIGFISVNVFRRERFLKASPEPYWGTMYPQLGMMVEAFSDARILQIGKPLVCHRTHTQEDKKQELGEKAAEQAFMADTHQRDINYFSLPLMKMLNHLLETGSLNPPDVARIRESTVCGGPLLDFIIQNVKEKAAHKKIDSDWQTCKSFFEKLPLTRKQKKAISPVIRTKTKTTPAFKHELPTISVITPSFNQGKFIQSCIKSVAKQTYQPIEHLVYDPGSTDGSREIAEKSPTVTLFKQSDNGQSDAVNNGMQRCAGEIIAWLNTDDFYADEHVLKAAAERFAQPDKPDIVYGRDIYIDEKDNYIRDAYINTRPETLPDRLQHEVGIMQPAAFFRMDLVRRVGLLRQDRHFSMDYDFWIRCTQKKRVKIAFVDQVFAKARCHSENKTYGKRDLSYEEVCDLMLEHYGYVSHIWLQRFAEFLSDGHDGIVKTGLNAGISDNEAFESIYRSLLMAFNGGHDAWKTISRSRRGPARATFEEMKKMGCGQATPCIEVKPKCKRKIGRVCYTMGDRGWAYDARWKQEQIERSHAFLRERIANRKSDTCIVVGNGPSLKKTNLQLLAKADVIVSNNCFNAPEVFNHADYYTVVNYLVAEQSAAGINRIQNVAKIIPYWLAYCLNPSPNTYFVDAIGYPEFSTDIFKNMSWRHTVTFFNLHLAYGLGFRKVILVGLDHNYIQPEGVKEREIIKTDAPDENHFTSSYFQGKAWQAADVNMMEEMYKLAKDAFELDGREIVNSTVGGKLELFRREPLEKALSDV